MDFFVSTYISCLIYSFIQNHIFRLPKSFKSLNSGLFSQKFNLPHCAFCFCLNSNMNFNFESALQVESFTLQCAYIVTKIPFYALSMIMISFKLTFLCTHICPWQHPHIYSCNHSRLPTSGSVCISCLCTHRNLQENENPATVMEQKILKLNKIHLHDSRESLVTTCIHTC